MKAPLFSIVIPTRNRGHLLGGALRSALEQENFDDYEIVVVNNACTDKTDEVVASLKTDRVRYVKTDRVLNMPLNWEFAWTNARGEYVLYLCDDDALLPNTLSHIAKHALHETPAIVTWVKAIYTFPSWVDATELNLLRILRDTGSIEEVESRSLRDEVLRFAVPAWAPRILNCCAHRGTLESVRAKVGRLFWPDCPDYGFLDIVLHTVPTIRVIHKPLGIYGKSPASIGATALVQPGEAVSASLAEYGEFDFFAGVPFKVPLTPTYIGATFVAVGKCLRDAGYLPGEIQWDDCLVACAVELRHQDTGSAETARLRAELRDAAAQRSAACLSRVDQALTRSGRVERSLLGRALAGSDILSRLEVAVRFGGDVSKARRPFRLKPGVFAVGDEVHVHGDDIGVSSILGMASVVSDTFETYARAAGGT